MIRSRCRVSEGVILGWLGLCALLSIAVSAAIIWVLASEAAHFFRHVPVLDFLLGVDWAPLFAPPKYGVLPLVWGTLMISAGALLFAVPVGVAAALYLSEYAPRWFREAAKPLLELLAGIPTVVYGYFALTFVTPSVLQRLAPQTETFNLAAGAIVVGIMILPTICSLCDDAFRSVPRALREGAYALAATKLEVSTRVVVPAALSGVFAAVLLALGRAIGETMAVTLAAGLQPRLTLNPFEGAQTMTAYIVNVTKGDVPAGSIAYYSIFAVGLVLFLMTLVVNLIAARVLRKFREVYE